MSKFAILGHGVVGSGTAELFLKNKDNINKRQGTDIDLKYILDIRDFPDSPYAEKFVKDINVILEDDEVTVVAECMGGINPAYTFVKSCLERGKSVCTSNKQLVAEKGAELHAVAKANNCNFMFEASTGGAIPILRPLHTCLAANEITAIAGILNGTTNFILTKMIEENMTFDAALTMAQQLGYAEKDPTADVEGHDACRKICILASLAFGSHVYPQWVYTEGISSVTLEDAAYATSANSAVKLIGSVWKLKNGKLLISVRPCFVCRSCQLALIDDVFNGIMVCGDGIDRVMFYGRGAGKLPTASAVLGDVIDCFKQTGTVMSQTWEDSRSSSFIEDHLNAEVRMYVRLDGVSRETAEKLFPGSVYLDREGKPESELAFITTYMLEKDIIHNLNSLGSAVLGKMPLLDM